MTITERLKEIRQRVEKVDLVSANSSEVEEHERKVFEEHPLLLDCLEEALWGLNKILSEDEDPTHNYRIAARAVTGIELILEKLGESK